MVGVGVGVGVEAAVVVVVVGVLTVVDVANFGPSTILFAAPISTGFSVRNFAASAMSFPAFSLALDIAEAKLLENFPDSPCFPITIPPAGDSSNWVVPTLVEVATVLPDS